MLVFKLPRHFMLLAHQAGPVMLNLGSEFRILGLLEVEEAFCHLKAYLRVRPVFHRRPDRVRNQVRICFLAYWLSAKLDVQQIRGTLRQSKP